MRINLFILLLLLLGWTANSQNIFRTIVSQQPVIAGESFAVQYVLQETENEEEFIAPSFTGLRLISGPDNYGGFTYGDDGPIPLKNIVYTLVAPKAGWITIPGASLKRNGKITRSNDVLVEVVDKKDVQKSTRGDRQESSEYFLKPGEDPYVKMKKNLFVEVTVDKRNCFVGEPVLATFKLYSRLESRSDIVKNPGFYGFTVHDVLNLNDKHSATEVIDGKLFDVHTIRMVQLYPFQAGKFIIDPMEVINKVEFSNSAIKRKTEQKIIEGVFPDQHHSTQANTVNFENTISTTPITVNVIPLPEKNKPADFTGATGNFTIHAEVERGKIMRNEQGNLLITLKGEGNFIQLEAPSVEWPKGVEGFSPEVIDSLDKSHTPLKGLRTFKFPFVASRAGTYHIPGITFNYFNPDTNNYKTVSTSSLDIVITDEEKEASREIGKNNNQRRPSYLLWMVLGLALIGLLVFAIQYRAGMKLKAKIAMQEANKQPMISVDDELLPAFDALRINDPGFYVILQKCTWNYLGKTLGISGSQMNKDRLAKVLETKNVPAEISSEFLNLLGQCDIASFTQAEPAIGKKTLLFRMKELLRQMRLIG